VVFPEEILNETNMDIISETESVPTVGIITLNTIYNFYKSGKVKGRRLIVLKYIPLFYNHEDFLSKLPKRL
jgi:hypothetical protein